MAKFFANLMMLVACAVMYAAGETNTVREMPTTEVSEFNKPKNVPTFTVEHAVAFPQCQEENVLTNTVLVITQGNDAVLMDFDKADRITHNDNPADDVWVIGYC